MFLFIVLGCFYASPSSAQGLCSQNGGNVPCKTSDLTYFVNGKYGKNPDTLKTQDVANYCASIAAGNLISCVAGANTRSPDPYNSPVYSYTITATYSTGSTPPTMSTTNGVVIGSTQNCPSSNSVERLGSSWVFFCRPDYYVSSTTIIPNLTSSLNPTKSASPKGNMCSVSSETAVLGNSSIADPIDISTGAKTLSQVDYTYDSSGALVDEYVYLDSRPIALLRSSNLYYIYTDHLNTPRAITDTSNALQWNWENKEAFGNNPPVEVVSGFKFNFRFPGQYFDTETNLNYNIHRDYNPVWGRYMSSDPLGLATGINTYGYVGGNSLRNSDSLGLFSQVIITDSYYVPGVGGSFGHVAIQVDNEVFGFYPTLLNSSNSRSLGLADSFGRTGETRLQILQEFKEDYDNNKASGFVLNISTIQEKALVNYFKNLAKNNPKYNLFGQSILGGTNCSYVGAESINKIIPGLNLDGFSPSSLEKDLLRLYINKNPIIKEYRKGLITK